MSPEVPKPSILLTGKNGQIGRALIPLLARMGPLAALDRQQLDLADSDQIRRAIRSLRPDVIVNAAAYTAVDQAESDEAAASAINAVAPGVMAEEAKRLGALFVHYSTDYVFDGSNQAPYNENDRPNPINVYGRTKLEGERAIEGAGPQYLIFRTAWVYARRGRNFLLTVLRLAAEKEELRIVRDQRGAPTSSAEIAAATVKVLSQILAPSSDGLSSSRFPGIYHMTAAGETTWYDFARLIVKLASTQASGSDWFRAATDDRPLIVQSITPVVTAEFPTAARRPAYSVLANRKLNQTFGVALPDWETQLRSVFSAPALEMHAQPAMKKK